MRIWDFRTRRESRGVINGLQTFLPASRAHGEGDISSVTASLAALVPMPHSSSSMSPPGGSRDTFPRRFARNSCRRHRGSRSCPGPVRTNIQEVARNQAGAVRRGRRLSQRRAGRRNARAISQHDGSGTSRRSGVERGAETTSCTSSLTANGCPWPRRGRAALLEAMPESSTQRSSRCFKPDRRL